MRPPQIRRRGPGSSACSSNPGRGQTGTHPEGQILYVVTGKGRAQREGGPVVEIGPGDVVYFSPGEKHWHGAAPETFMVHIAVNPAASSDGGTDWMEPVTDEEYSGDAG